MLLIVIAFSRASAARAAALPAQIDADAEGARQEK
jgi:hypothetical protein